VVFGIAIATLFVGVGLAAFAHAISHDHAPNAADDGLQTAQNFATRLQALSAYDPTFINQISAGQKFQIPASYALTPSGGTNGTTGTVTFTVTGVNTHPDATARTLGVVSVSFTVDGKTQSANIPIAAIAPANPGATCNPVASGSTANCVTE
jgi:carbohydrate-binding DOMON domain-containing protein